MYKCSESRMEDKIKTFSRFGDAGHGGITRYSLSPEALLARQEFEKRMKAIGATIEVDDVGDLYATLPGSDPTAKRIVMGSHVDSVNNGGNYDGILGVMSAMEVLETVAEQNIPHKHPLTAMIWTNEEGSLYPPAMMCSGIVCYDYLPEDIRSKFQYEDMMASKSVLDPTKTFGEALAASGYQGDKKFRLSTDRYQYMFETHIEQGPILEDNGNDIGVVDCVLGMFNYRLKFYGQTVHAGTFPMPKRHDAFWAAAQALCYLHEKIDALGIPELVYTTGEVVCHPCVHTCVPDYFDFSLDVRHEDPKALEQVLAVVKSCAGGVCEGRRRGAGGQPPVHPFRRRARRPVLQLCDSHHHDFCPVEGRAEPLRAGVFLGGPLYRGGDGNAERRTAGRSGLRTEKSGAAVLSTVPLFLVFRECARRGLPNFPPAPLFFGHRPQYRPYHPPPAGGSTGSSCCGPPNTGSGRGSSPDNTGETG